MKGIQYITDEAGERTAVILDLKKYRDLWEDIEDAIIAKMRKNEPKIPLNEVEKRLKSKGKIVD
jgi:hypothetical protein